MAKRFTDTEKWEDPWFMELSNRDRLIYLYLLDKCDNAGFWKPNISLLCFFLKIEITLDEILIIMADRIVVAKSGKWFIKQFVKFQYNELHPQKPATASVIKKLNENGVTLCNHLIKVMPFECHKDKDKEKDKVKVKDKESEQEKLHTETKTRSLQTKRGKSKLNPIQNYLSADEIKSEAVKFKQCLQGDT